MSTETTVVLEGENRHLEIKQGATYKHVFHYQDEEGVTINLNGYTGRMQMRKTVSDTTVLYEATTSDDIAIDGAAGNVTLTIPAATSTAWTFRRAVYDLEIVSGGGEVVRLVKGRVKVDPEVTR